MIVNSNAVQANRAVILTRIGKIITMLESRDVQGFGTVVWLRDKGELFGSGENALGYSELRLRDTEMETVEKALLFIHEQAIRCAVNLIYGEVR